MRPTMSRRILRPFRRGLAILEITLVILMMLLVTFGAIEYAWMFLKVGEITNAARAGARIAVLPDSTATEVNNAIDSLLATAGMGSSSYVVTFTPADLTTLDVGDPLEVDIDVPYTNVTILGLSFLPVPTTLNASVTMAKEGP